jgi:hypothetical protein
VGLRLGQLKRHLLGTLPPPLTSSAALTLGFLHFPAGDGELMVLIPIHLYLLCPHSSWSGHFIMLILLTDADDQGS